MRVKIHFHTEENPFSYGRKSIFVGGNRKSTPRSEQILRNFDLLLPKFHFILSNFYIPPLWGMFVFQRAICRFLRRGDRALKVSKSFPPLENCFSTLGKLVFHRWKVCFPPLETSRLWEGALRLYRRTYRMREEITNTVSPPSHCRDYYESSLRGLDGKVPVWHHYSLISSCE